MLKVNKKNISTYRWIESLYLGKKIVCVKMDLDGVEFDIKVNKDQLQWQSVRQLLHLLV